MSLEVRLKGINFIGSLESLERLRGAEVRREVEAGLEGEVGDLLRTNSLLVGGWYPASWYGEVLQRIADVTGGGDRLLREVSISAVQKDFTTLFKVVRLLFSPKSVMPQVLRVHKRYVEGGTVELAKATNDSMRVRLSDCHGFNRVMWVDYVSGIEAILQLLGCKNIVTRVVSGGGDESHMDVLVRFEKR